MALSAHPQIGRIYAGAVLETKDGDVALQQRDIDPGIRNSGLITTFGGTAEADETPKQALIRELVEELNLDVARDAVVPLCVIDKLEEDGSPTRCFFFCVNEIQPDELTVLEGQAITARPPAEFLSDQSVTETCKSALRQYLLRARYCAASTEPDELKLVGLVSDRAHIANEDMAGYNGPLACLIDGASPNGVASFLHETSDARWIAETAIDLILPNGSDQRPLVVILRDTLTRIRERLLEAGFPKNVPPPSGAIGLVRIRNRVVEYAAISDVTIAIESVSGTWVLEDRVSTEREAYLMELEESSGKQAVQDAVHERRTKYMNRFGGYWVFSNDPTAAEFSRFGFVDLRSEGRVLLASDGFARVVAPFGITTWRSVLTGQRSDLESLLHELRQQEGDDPDRRSFPRISANDDATALLLSVV